MFCFACSGKAKGEEKETKKQEIEKRHFQPRKMHFQSLSWSQIKIASFMKHAAPRAYICNSLFCL